MEEDNVNFAPLQILTVADSMHKAAHTAEKELEAVEGRLPDQKENLSLESRRAEASKVSLAPLPSFS